MQNEKSIEVLNSLIIINNDRIEGYETASDASEESDLKTLFSQFIESSQKCRFELINQVNSLGGEVAEGTTISGKFFRAWMDVKAALSGKDRKAILNSCEFGEDSAQKTYNQAINNDFKFLTPGQQTMVNMQKDLLKADHDHVKSLRDAL